MEIIQLTWTICDGSGTSNGCCSIKGTRQAVGLSWVWLIVVSGTRVARCQTCTRELACKTWYCKRKKKLFEWPDVLHIHLTSLHLFYHFLFCCHSLFLDLKETELNLPRIHYSRKCQFKIFCDMPCCSQKVFHFTTFVALVAAFKWYFLSISHTFFIFIFFGCCCLVEVFLV